MGVAEATMRELTEKGAAWIDVQYIKQATIALNEARQMLKYTYVYGYFLPAHVNRSIFEYLQGTAPLCIPLQSRRDEGCPLGVGHCPINYKVSKVIASTSLMQGALSSPIGVSPTFDRLSHCSVSR